MSDHNQLDIHALGERGLALDFSSFSLPAMDESVNEKYKMRIAH